LANSRQLNRRLNIIVVAEGLLHVFYIFKKLSKLQAPLIELAIQLHVKMCDNI
jgi:hypothetical protein